MIKSISTICVFVLSLSTALPANASVYSFSYQGMFSVLNPGGNSIDNVVGRVDISGALSYDDIAGEGTFSVAPFVITSSALPVESTPATILAVGDGQGNTGCFNSIRYKFYN